MLFEWDERKNIYNKKVHGVSFNLAQRVFDDPFQKTRFDRTIGGEDRFHTSGNVAQVIILVVHCDRKTKDGEEIIRVISARKATRRERAWYHWSAGG